MPKGKEIDVLLEPPAAVEGIEGLVGLCAEAVPHVVEITDNVRHSCLHAVSEGDGIRALGLKIGGHYG